MTYLVGFNGHTECHKSSVHPCVKCKADTPHRRGHCYYCMTPTPMGMRAQIKIKNKQVIDEKGRRAAMARFNRNQAIVNSARRNALHEAAERSRAMFEGKK